MSDNALPQDRKVIAPLYRKVVNRKLKHELLVPIQLGTPQTCFLEMDTGSSGLWVRRIIIIKLLHIPSPPASLVSALEILSLVRIYLFHLLNLRYYLQKFGPRTSLPQSFISIEDIKPYSTRRIQSLINPRLLTQTASMTVECLI
jgi:hypothetical protein